MPNNVTLAMIKSAPGKRDEIMQVFDRYASEYIENKSSFHSFFYCFDSNDPDGIIIFILGDEAAASDFRNQPWFSDFQKTTHDLIGGPGDMRQATPKFVKGTVLA